MISQKQREEMLNEAAKAICASASGLDEDYALYLEDARAALAVIEPILRQEIETDYANIQAELDRLVEENESLTQRVEEMEAGY